jgi:hypothetical protein
MAASAQNAGAILYVPYGHYRLSQTLFLTKQIILRGTSGAFGNPGSALVFDDGVTGIHIKFYDDGRTGPLGDGTVIEHIGVMAINKTIAGAHGVRMKARATVRDCFIRGFSGDGINIVADDKAPVGSMDRGNASSFNIYNVRIEECGNHGVFVHGGDANAGLGVLIDCTHNGKWGIYDSSFLGNTWVACHTEANAAAYKNQSPDGFSLFIGCYSESSQSPSQINSTAIVIGGDHGAGFDPAYPCQRFMRYGLTTPILTRNDRGAHSVFAEIGVDDNTESAMRWRASDDSSWWAWKYDAAARRWKFRHADTDGHLKQTVTTSRSFVDNVRRLTFPQGFWVGDPKIERRHVTLNAVPRETLYRPSLWTRGDRIYNCDPVAGGTEGWICTRTGGWGTPWSAGALIAPGDIYEPPSANGYVYICSGYTASAWSGLTHYSVDDIRAATTGTVPFVFRCINPGASASSPPQWPDGPPGANVPESTGVLWQAQNGATGSSPPSWSTTIGVSFSDGNVMWTCAGVTPPIFKDFGTIAS